MICECRGREHIVCKPKWRIVKGDPFPRVAWLSIAKAIAQGLTITPYDKRWDERETLTRAKCEGCGNHDDVSTGRKERYPPKVPALCITCFVKRLHETPVAELEGVAS